MADFIKVAAAGAKQSPSEQSIEIRHSVLIEVVAALLGYHTFAALNAEELDQSLDRHLGDAQVLILNEKLGLKRSFLRHGTTSSQSYHAENRPCRAPSCRGLPSLKREGTLQIRWSTRTAFARDRHLHQPSAQRFRLHNPIADGRGRVQTRLVYCAACISTSVSLRGTD